MHAAMEKMTPEERAKFREGMHRSMHGEGHHHDGGHNHANGQAEGHEHQCQHEHGNASQQKAVVKKGKKAVKKAKK